MNEQERARALDIARRYGGDHLAPAALERDILLFGRDSFLLARREGDVYYVSHLVGPPKAWMRLVYDLARELRRRGEQDVVVRAPAGSVVTQHVVRVHPDLFRRVGDYYESTARAWPV